MSWIAVGIGAGVGLLNGVSQSNAQAKAQKQNADISAAQTQYSPWTHITPQSFQAQPNNAMGGALGGVVNGGLAGAMHNQANANQQAQNDLTKAQTGFYNSQNPWVNLGKPTMYDNNNVDPSKMTG